MLLRHMRTRLPRLSRRRRLLWAGVVLFCLLFQQLAMAAYVCTLPATSAPTVSVMADCAGMNMGKASHDSTAGHVSDPRCTEHCANHVPTTPDARAPVVPPLLLPADFADVAKAVAHASPREPLPNPELYPPDPPPSLRFCSLLI